MVKEEYSTYHCNNIKSRAVQLQRVLTTFRRSKSLNNTKIDW